MKFEIESNIQDLISSIGQPITLTDETIQKLAEMTRDSIIRNMDTGIDIYGLAMQAKWNNKKLFINTGESDLIHSPTINGTKEVVIEGRNATIASYLNYGTPTIPKREFFGISNTLETEIEDYLNKTKLENLVEGV